MATAEELPRTPTPNYGLNDSISMAAVEEGSNLNISGINNASGLNNMSGIGNMSGMNLDSSFADPNMTRDSSRPATSLSGKGLSSSMILKPEDIPPDIIKRYTDAFKLYEAKKTIKPGKAQPPAEGDDKKGAKKGDDKKKSAPAKKGTDKKGGKNDKTVVEPAVQAPPQPTFTILKGHVLISDLLTLMRALMKNPKEKDLPLYLSILPNSEEVVNRCQLNLDEFLRIMQNAPIPNQDDHFKILDAFETFDDDFKGEFEPEKLKFILATMGEKDLMTQEEIDEILLTFTNPENKSIAYDEFLKTCLSNTNVHDPPPPKTAKKGTKKKATK
ncbi:predicted protein [Naegleria gruberi]|uniref:Predicted protein n=1 Tax=Naegleria gruberi TaxID=5762 RepID=D2W2T5_NAEGR|nr:uncharacterized protein NAEGRDRAFT_75706 [Naegleria gruberi]EFC36607.1 predicted protein [Naegleria gruberi]|eukprot:XP_002669351.1 predicted protein [Naegleria gruberi strain NEG-M]